MRTFGMRIVLGIAGAGLTVAGLAGCSGDKGGGGPAANPPAGNPSSASSGGAATPTASTSPGGGSGGGDSGVAKRQEAGVPSGFPDACGLVTGADLTKAIRLNEEPQSDTIGRGDDAISVCSYTNGEGTTIIVRSGMADHYDAEVRAGDKVTKATNKKLTGVGEQARMSTGENAPGLTMVVITSRNGDKYVQVVAAIYGLKTDQLQATTKQLTSLALSRL